MEPLAQRIRKLTEQLVRIDSSYSYGQRKLADVLFATLSETIYIKEHPDRLQKIPVDLPGNPFTLLALYRPPRDTRETVVLCGHYDTVGVAEFGREPAIAFDLSRLPQWLASRYPTDEELLADIQSGDFMFGRGSLDMKGGVALLISLFDHIAERSTFPWNLALVLTCDEEESSSGMKAALPTLRQMQEEDGLDFRLFLNADFTSPLTPGDKTAYLYTGTVGKLLIGISVFGIPTHASTPFEGVGAPALIAAIASHLEGNHKLTQHVHGEFTPPPTVLSTDARQAAYSVMTPTKADAYVNLFFAHSSFGDYFREVVNEIRRACRLHLTALRRRYRRFIAKTDMKVSERLFRPEVITYAELARRAGHPTAAQTAPTPSTQSTPESTSAADGNDGSNASPDNRRLALDYVAGIMHGLGWSRPTVVVSVLPPFYAAYAMMLDPEAQQVAQALRKFLAEWKGGFPLRHRNSYPYISDMSFVRTMKPERLKPLLEQAPPPAQPEIDAVSQHLRIPVANLGPWGKGAHTVREHVHIGFLTEELPKMYLALLNHLTGSEAPP